MKSEGAKGETVLYLHVFDWPKDRKLRVPDFNGKLHAAKIQSATILGADSKLQVFSDGMNAVIEVPDAAPDEVDTVVKVRLDSER